MARKQIPKIEELSGDSKKLFDILNREADLPAILVGASFLDTTLSSNLEKKFIESSISQKLLDSNSAALGAFVARADICYVLGIIDKPMYQDLITITEIRNEAAHHHLELSFDTESIADKCSSLSYVSTLKQGKTEEPLEMDEYMTTARAQFML